MLIVFPLGVLGSSIIFDILYLAGGNPRWAEIAYWMILVGVVSGLTAAVFGLIDWLAIPSATRAKRIGLLHGLGNVVVVLIFVVKMMVCGILTIHIRIIVLIYQGIIILVVIVNDYEVFQVVKN